MTKYKLSLARELFRSASTLKELTFGNISDYMPGVFSQTQVPTTYTKLIQETSEAQWAAGTKTAISGITLGAKFLPTIVKGVLGALNPVAKYVNPIFDGIIGISGAISPSKKSLGDAATKAVEGGMIVTAVTGFITGGYEFSGARKFHKIYQQAYADTARKARFATSSVDSGNEENFEAVDLVDATGRSVLPRKNIPLPKLTSHTLEDSELGNLVEVIEIDTNEIAPTLAKSPVIGDFIPGNNPQFSSNELTLTPSLVKRANGVYTEKEMVIEESYEQVMTRATNQDANLVSDEPMNSFRAPNVHTKEVVESIVHSKQFTKDEIAKTLEYEKNPGLFKSKLVHELTEGRGFWKFKYAVKTQQQALEEANELIQKYEDISRTITATTEQLYSIDEDNDSSSEDQDQFYSLESPYIDEYSLSIDQYNQQANLSGSVPEIEEID